ncbi:MAG: aldehyde dehydrogenase [Gemmataceae bacterium]|nr:MAG: aldehyde dehydrogenase [Gemmataceae bacterium]
MDSALFGLELYSMTMPLEGEVLAARSALPSWSGKTISQRLQFIRRLREQLVCQREKLWQAASDDVKRSPQEVLASELLPIASALKFLERHARRILAPRKVSLWDRPLWLWGCRDVVHRRPWGVVGIIGTWNYPLFLNIVPIAQALTAGNTVLWKPSEQAPRCAQAIGQLFQQAGVDRDVLQILPATREAGPQLAEADIDYLLFTGSEAVGRRLASRLGERLIPSTLELSGCDPMWVLANADISLAVRAAWFGMTFNRGQTCIAVRRILVQRSIAEAFYAELQSWLERAKPFSSLPLQTPAQEEQFRRLVADAAERGADLLPAPDTEVSPGCRPTFLWNVPAEAAVMQEPCFAPLATIAVFDTIEQALALTRQCRSGLAASIFTKDMALAQHLAAQLPAGYVTVNDVLAPTAHPATPFGGRGASGWGVTQGTEGLLSLTVPQVVSIRHGRFRPHYDETISPASSSTHQILEGLLRGGYSRSWRERWRGLRQLFRGLFRR